MRKMLVTLVVSVGLLLVPSMVMADSPTPNLDALDYWYLSHPDEPAETFNIQGLTRSPDGGFNLQRRLPNGAILERPLLSRNLMRLAPDSTITTLVQFASDETGFDIAIVCDDRGEVDCAVIVARPNVLTVEYLEQYAGTGDEL